MGVLWRGEPWYWDLFTIIIEYHQRIGGAAKIDKDQEWPKTGL